MDDFVICTRKVRRGKFRSEPGRTRFLRVPAGAMPEPGMTTPRTLWVKAVMAAAETGRNEQTGQPAGDILVFIHGYNSDQKKMMTRHRIVRETLTELGYAGAVVSFDWPSADSPLNYLEDRSDAKFTAIRLVDDGISLFSRLQRPDCEINLHLLAHSTGAFVVREAFDDADDRPQIAATNWTVSQVAFIAADISQKSLQLGNPKSASLFRHTVRLTNYSNPHDAVLKLSNVKRLGTASRAGRVGLPENHHPAAVNVDCGRYYRSKISDAPAHSWYFGDPRFTHDLYYTLMGNIDRHCIPTRVADAQGRLHLLAD